MAGVINVDNHLEVVLPPGDDRDDPLLTTAANNALAPGHRGSGWSRGDR